MPRLFAFLRAINVGGHTVKMDHLRGLFEELGFSKVETFIASGNVIFESDESGTQALESRIEDHLQAALGYEVATFIRTEAELADIAQYQPFPVEQADTGGSLYIAFLKATTTTQAQHDLMAFRTDIDDFHVHGREVYWLCRTSLSQSTFSGARLEKTLGMPATLRNVTTVQKLAAKYPASQ
ncbi:MAG: DUF1697 domain-containing protein [Chloroflexota bacterium]|nr:DUF1697 domain-containing protein [Chloroflexota bacterium]